MRLLNILHASNVLDKHTLGLMSVHVYDIDYTATDLITATAHKLARIFYTMMRYGVTYQKQSEAEFVEHNRQRLEKSLRRRAKELGFELKKIEPPPPDPAAATTPSD